MLPQSRKIFPSDPSTDFLSLITSAKSGDQDALGSVLEASRDYLRSVACSSLDNDIQAKLSVSDLVQDALIDAQRGFAQFRGTSQGELLAWLRQILVNNLLNQYRRFRDTQKRQVARETALASHEFPLAYASDETPSTLSVRREEHDLLNRAIKGLSPNHQQIIELRHRETLSFNEIGQRLGRSSDAARMLWYRAFDQLSSELERLTK